MICSKPIERGDLKGKTATGTYAGWQRHRRNNEPPCVDCLKGYNEHQAASRRAKNAKKSREKRPDYNSWGGQRVRCLNCGEVGTANRMLVGRARTIPFCTWCREVA